MAGQSTRIRVSLVALPDAMVSPVSGLFEVLASAAAMAEPAADRSTFRVASSQKSSAPLGSDARSERPADHRAPRGR
jgi:transcriptional regulator GlxA family with amidase domain